MIIIIMIPLDGNDSAWKQVHGKTWRQDHQLVNHQEHPSSPGMPSGPGRRQPSAFSASPALDHYAWLICMQLVWSLTGGPGLKVSLDPCKYQSNQQWTWMSCALPKVLQTPHTPTCVLPCRQDYVLVSHIWGGLLKDINCAHTLLLVFGVWDAYFQESAYAL